VSSNEAEQCGSAFGEVGVVDDEDGAAAGFGIRRSGQREAFGQSEALSHIDCNEAVTDNVDEAGIGRLGLRWKGFECCCDASVSVFVEYNSLSN